jgi:uncharacterized protein (DUF983 family)
LNVQITAPTAEIEAGEVRPLIRSMLRGFRCRCPKCGEGKLFSSFSKSVERCATCGEEIHHHRADDFPAYLVIFVVGHVIVAGYLATEMWFEWTMLQYMAFWLPVTLLLSVLLLQPLKGAVIGLQWALRMHGFSGHDDTASRL